MVFINVIASLKPLLNFGCIDGSRSLSSSRILKFDKILTWVGSKNFGTGEESVSSEISDLQNF